MKSEFKIGNKFIGDGYPTFIIAEAGSNHNGNIEQAKRLIELAAEAGADAVKFQTFKAKTLYVKDAGESDYLKVKTSIYDIIESMEMPEDWIPALSEHCRKNKILFISSAFSEDSVDKLDPYINTHKVASYELNHIPLLKYVASKNKPIILSTGACTMEEIDYSVNAIDRQGNDGLCLMQCVAAYPAPPEASNLKAIVSLKEKYKIPVGLSDHTRDPFTAPLGAIALGANVIEKHFTISNQLPGPDQPYAVEPHELKEMILRIRELEKALGDGKKKVEPVEKELFYFAKRAVHAIQSIKKGDVFSEENVAVLRPGKQERGVAPKHFENIIGKTAKKDIKPFEGIKETDY
ncbi:MAG: shikimate dehydrogenase [Nanohaloarchaea archaeon]|nr:shikimate dehydrogenase [Candidatus Nanohaloarchaea archaeon]